LSWLIGLTLLGFASAPYAQGEAARPPLPGRCPLYTEVAPYLAADDTAPLRAYLLPPERVTDDDCRALQIHMAMRLGEWALADAHLQPYLRAHPEDAGAWLDLAIARHREGDREGAQELFVLIENRFAPPAIIRQLIAQLRSEKPPGDGTRRLAVEVQYLSFMLVHDSNANMGLAHSQLELTFDDRILPLRVARSNLPHADWAGQFQYLAIGSLDLARASPDDAERLPPLEWLFRARTKNYQQQSDYDNQALQLSVAQPLQRGAQGFVVRAGVQRDWLGNAGSIDGVRLGAVYQLPISACLTSLGMEYEGRRYGRSSQLDGDIFWLGGEATCLHPSLPDSRLQLWLRAGMDQARRADRPGGDTDYQEAGLVFTQRFASGWQGDLFWQWGDARDQHGYSPILDNGHRRDIERHIVGLALEYRITASTALQAQWSDYDQRSNIPLFSARNRSLSFGLTYNW
jgi:hypothetical protein